MTTVSLNLLGGFEVVAASNPPLVLPTKKSKALLAYLALNNGHTHSRDKLAGLLWGRSGDEQARGSLRQALSQLRRALPMAKPCCLVADGDSISLAGAVVAVDVAEFERHVAAATPDSLERAAALYHGDLLDGLILDEDAFDEWMTAERARLRDLAQGALARLLDHYTATGAIERGIQTARRLLALDPLQEGVHRRLIRFYLEQERRGAAIAQYRRCCKLLRRELGVDPEAETRRLHEEILHRRPGVPPLELKDMGLERGVDGDGVNSAATPVAGAGAVSRLAARPVVAVLPFDDLSGAAGERYFSDGVTEDIITELARFRDIYVIARNSSFAFRDAAVPVPRIGAELGADYVVEGSVRRAEGRVRVTAQLIEAPTGRHVWADRFDREVENVFAAQDEVTRRIVATLVGRIEDERLAEAKRKPPESLEAYDHWLQGMACLRTVNTESSQRARAAFERALEADPQYARAYAGIAMAQYRQWSCFNWNAMWKLEEKAFDFARKAVALDDSDHHAHCILGLVYVFLRQFERAERHIERALALNPNDANTLANVAVAWALLGDRQGAVEAAETAIRLDPYHPDWYLASLGCAYFGARRYDDAVAAMERAPDSLCDTRAYLAAACAHAGRDAAAARHRGEFTRFCRERFGGDPETEMARYMDWLVNTNAYRHDADLEHFVDGLRKAGLPA